MKIYEKIQSLLPGSRLQQDRVRHEIGSRKHRHDAIKIFSSKNLSLSVCVTC